MTQLDIKIIPKVFKLIQKHGKTVEFVETTGGGAYDPATRKTTNRNKKKHNVKVTPPDKYKEDEIDGDVIRRGDSRILVPSQGLLFEINEDTIQFLRINYDTLGWEVKSYIPYYSGELIAVYELQLRRL